MSKELEAFKRVWEDCSQLDLDYVSKHNLMDDLREIEQALKRNEPMKVDIQKLSCPNCNKPLPMFILFQNLDKYCIECGQKLDWRQ